MKHNPVAKNSHLSNTAKVYKDRKKAFAKGYTKHKGKLQCMPNL